MNNPQSIGRYQVKSELGRGGMATVYLAYDPQFKRDVAIKVLPPELLHDLEFRSRFEREATVIASLEHPAIVPVHDFGEQGGQPYLVMRYMSNGSLSDRIKRGPMRLDEVVRIITRIAPALDDAHQKKVIHRDLKPDNILFDLHEEPYISDFGIAKLSEATATLTGNVIIGTPAYMSPEQGRGDADIDGRSDVYSLGVIIFEMLTGRVPFESSTPMGQLYKHLTEPVPNILSFRPDLPPDIQRVMTQAMAKRSYVRYSTTNELASALQAVAQGRPLPASGVAQTISVPGSPISAAPSVVPRPAPQVTPAQSVPRQLTPQPMPTQPQKHWASFWPWLLLVLGLLLVAGTVGWFVFPDQLQSWFPFLPGEKLVAEAPTLTPEAITPTEVVMATIEPSPTLALVTDTPLPQALPTDTQTSTLEPTISLPVVAPVGQADMIAFINNGDIYVANIDGSDPQQLTTDKGQKMNLQFTPDGQAVTYAVESCVQFVTIRDVQKGAVICLSGTSITGFEFSRDGKFVALTIKEGVYILDYNPERIKKIKTPDQLNQAPGCVQIVRTEFEPRRALWSQDGKSLAVLVHRKTGIQRDVIYIYRTDFCTPNPERIATIPKDDSEAQKIEGYRQLGTIVDFAWDGLAVFAFNLPRSADFGCMVTYKQDPTGKKNEIVTYDPLHIGCFYRGFHWSPDGQFFTFTVKGIRSGEVNQIYYQRYTEVQTGAKFNPLAFPQDIPLTGITDPQPAFRYIP